MNPGRPIESEGDEKGTGFAHVLRAEREANAAIGRCRGEAHAIVTDAEAEARAVSERADQRLSRLRERLRGDLARALAKLDAQGGDPVSSEISPERLENAVATLARELTSGRE